jgi:O-antigen ligase
LGGPGLDLEPAKNLVGGQRFGFIYLLAIWLVYFHQGRKKLFVLIRYLLLSILLAGLLLTFSRSSIVALLGSFGFFALAVCVRWLRRPNLAAFRKGLLSVVLACLLVVLLLQIVPVTFSFFEERLFKFLADTSRVMQNLKEPVGSEGVRVYILQSIFSFVLDNPITGAGYLGVWILEDPLFGSAHNQYADVLFRTGVYGFLAYIYLLFLLLRYLFANERALFWGLVSVLIYGMFHETFKESQGGFVLAFLMGTMSQSLRKSKAIGNQLYLLPTG